MRGRRWWYVVVLGAGVAVLTPFLVGSASASHGSVSVSPPKPTLPSSQPTAKSATAPASAPRVSGLSPFVCGEVATTSITLTADENCPGNTAIFAGANSIVINLNGHTLTGDGTHFGVDSNNFNGVIVENGVIDDFGYGVVLIGNSSRATGLRVNNNATDGIVSEGNSNVVTGNYALSNSFGIVAAFSISQQVTSNWVASSTGYGIFVEFVTGSIVISNNKVLNTTTTGGSGYGIVAEDDRGSVTGNVANGNAADGIYLNNPGIGVKPLVTASNNRAAFNAGYGIDSVANSAIDGGTNVVQDNTNALQCVNIVCHEVST